MGQKDGPNSISFAADGNWGLASARERHAAQATAQPRLSRLNLAEQGYNTSEVAVTVTVTNLFSFSPASTVICLKWRVAAKSHSMKQKKPLKIP